MMHSGPFNSSGFSDTGSPTLLAHFHYQTKLGNNCILHGCDAMAATKSVFSWTTIYIWQSETPNSNTSFLVVILSKH